LAELSKGLPGGGWDVATAVLVVVGDECLQAILELANGFFNLLWGLVGHKVGAFQVEFWVVVKIPVLSHSFGQVWYFDSNTNICLMT
jgi:hypothetical protein